MLKKKNILTLLALFYLANGFGNSPPNPVTQDYPFTPKNPKEALSNSMTKLNDLITATKESYDNQMQLRDAIIEYKKLHALCTQYSQDTTLLLQLVRKGDEILNRINANHLTHLFDSEFIKEISMLSRMAKKQGVPKP